MRKIKIKKRSENMLTKEHVNSITLESIQFKNIVTKVAAFCMQKIKEYNNVKEVS